ncbi:MAG TPA: hypothetical protein VFU06_01365 [Longimicrobiales bacterium]|nr:hypothetical protein [Longimicrobiales bacterium]
MPARIVTDASGLRWDVVQEQGSDSVVFRHQSGREVRTQLGAPLDSQSTEDLLDALDRAQRERGGQETGHEGEDVTRGEGYVAGS